MDTFEKAVYDLGKSLSRLHSSEHQMILKAAQLSLHFQNDDSVDFVDFLNQVRRFRIPNLDPTLLAQAQAATNQLIIANQVTQEYKEAHGISLWIPSSRETYERFAPLYRELAFEQASQWDDALKAMLIPLKVF